MAHAASEARAAAARALVAIPSAAQLESHDDPPPSGAAKDSGPSSNDRAPDEVPAKGEFVLVVYHAWIEYLAMLCYHETPLQQAAFQGICCYFLPHQICCLPRRGLPCPFCECCCSHSAM